MPFKLRDSMSLEALLEYILGVVAALLALPDTEEFAPPWLDLEQKLLSAQAQRYQERRALRLASGRVKAFDALWDVALMALSGMAYLLAGKKASADPYASLFGSVKAKDATNLGPYKAVALGETLVLRARQLNHPKLAESVDQLDALNRSLKEADDQRTAAQRVVRLQDIQRDELLATVERQIVLTEVDFVKKHPDQVNRIRAILAPDRPEPRARGGSPDEGDGTAAGDTADSPQP